MMNTLLSSHKPWLRAALEGPLGSVAAWSHLQLGERGALSQAVDLSTNIASVETAWSLSKLSLPEIVQRVRETPVREALQARIAELEAKND